MYRQTSGTLQENPGGCLLLMAGSTCHMREITLTVTFLQLNSRAGSRTFRTNLGATNLTKINSSTILSVDVCAEMWLPRLPVDGDEVGAFEIRGTAISNYCTFFESLVRCSSPQPIIRVLGGLRV